MRLRAVVGGAIAGAGNWSVTAEFALGAGVANLAVLQAVATALQTNLAASTAFKNGICTDTTCVAPKLLYYPVDTGRATLVAEGAGASFAGGIAPIHAPQVACVASLRTDFAGRSARGRMYIPYRGSNVAATGVVQNSGQVSVAAAAQAVATAVISALAGQGISATWVVFSGVNGTAKQITAIYVGNRCDTQRRRNPNREETYTATPVTAVQLQPADEAAAEQLLKLAQSRILPIDQVLAQQGEFWQQAYDVLPVPVPPGGAQSEPERPADGDGE